MSAAPVTPLATIHRGDPPPWPRGRSLLPMASDRFRDLPQFAAVGHVLEAEGYRLRDLTVPHYTPDGSVVVRLVWRRRADGASAVLHETLRGSLPDTLLDALLGVLERV